jgi:hypothetical protein
MPIIGVSAQDYRNANDYGSSYGNNNNGMVESYSYEEPNTYNTNNNDYNNYDPYIGEQNSEYSSYGNSYGPPTPDYGDGNVEEYSSYGNSYEYPSNTGYMDDSYYSSDDPGLYGNQYNNYYDEGSYDSNYYPPKKPQKFTCPDSGLVVDKPESCPVICPVGSTLAGHFVAAGSNLTQICNVDQQVLETCPAGSDLEGVFVTDATPEQCNIFATCDFRTPLGQALGLNSTQTVEVADPQLCQLDVPEPTQIFQCPETANEDVPFLNPVMAGQNVTSLELCQAATPAVQCGPLTTLNGTWVHPDATETCNLVIPPPFEPFTCEADTPLGIALGGIEVDVVDPELCNLSVPEPVTIFECPDEATEQVPFLNPVMAGQNVTSLALCEAATPAVQCLDGSTLEGVWVHPANQTTTCNIAIPPLFRCEADTPNVNPDLIGANVTDIRLCEAPTSFNICPEGTDLEGAYVNNTAASECNLDGEGPPTTDPQAQCIKCADLAIIVGGGQSFQVDAAEALVGNSTNNVFTICDDEDPTAQYNATMNEVAGSQADEINDAFAICLDNAPTEPNGFVFSVQENSLTTNVKTEAEIPTFSVKTSPPAFSPPSVPAAGGSSDALEKIAKLKQQWLDLLP